MEAWGLDLLCANPRWNSNSLTVIKTPPGVDSGNIVKTAYCKYNLSLGVGLMKVQGQVFRIGHLGFVCDRDVLTAVAAIESVLQSLGLHQGTMGAGLSAASDALDR